MLKSNFKPGAGICAAIEKWLLSCLAVLCLLVTWGQPASAAGSGYRITSYNSDIRIGTDNVYHITETIKVYFDVPSHGIYRYIPYIQKMNWNQDGTTARVYHTKVESVEVPDEIYTTNTENGNVVIQIGDPNKIITGAKTYTIKYDHALGNDKTENTDFVYYNIIGTQWDCAIDHVTFNIAMPKPFDPAKLWFFRGAYGSSAAAGVTYSVSQNTAVSGTLDTPLAPGEGLTIQMDLPQGYFEVPPPFPWSYFIVAAAAVFASAGLILYFLYGKNPHLVVTAEYYPPNEITSAEAGYIIDSSTDDKDVVSLIIYWASKGYLRIEQIGKNDFKFIKLKELPDGSGYEAYFFGRLFENRQEVQISDLQEKIYPAIEETKKRVESLYAKKDRQLYTKTSAFLGGLLSFLVFILIVGSLLYVMYETVYSFNIITIAAFFLFMVLILLTLSSLREAIRLWNGMARVKRSLKLTVRIFLSSIVLILYVAYFYLAGIFFTGIASAAAALLLTVISAFMRRRTEYGSELLGRLLGFKSFLELAERARLERLVEQNPSYFYDIIPFAYVLGVSETWAKKFEGIAMRPPEWYTGPDAGLVTPLLFQAALFRSMLIMSNAMTARPARAAAAPGIGGGGFGGGGFSGGGFGGGGGGRW